MRRVAGAGSLLLLLVLVLASADASAAPGTGRLLVLTRPGASAARVPARIAAVRATGLTVPEIGLSVVRPAAGMTLARAREAARAAPGVESVQVERRSRPRRTPDDPALRDLDTSPGMAPGTPLEWWAAREGFPGAWSRATGRGISVGVIDTGIDATHPDLAGTIAAAVRPKGDASPAPAGSDQDGHGTHVASLACAATDNGIGLAGAGFGCRLVVEKVDFSDASIAAAIVDAAKRRVQVLNMSFGDNGDRDVPEVMRRALRYALARGVVLVAAASDDGQPGLRVTSQGAPASVLQPPGTGPHLGAGIGLSVTAADVHDRRALFAGSGSEISLAAYGTYDYGTLSDGLGRAGPPGLFGAFPRGRTSADASGGCTCRTTLGGQSYAYLEGTSMAAPQVSGAAALVRALNPDLGPLAVVRLLERTARRRHGWTPDLGWGILDAGAALRAAARIDRRAPDSRVTRAGARRHGTVLLHVAGRDPAPRGVRSSGIARFELFAVPAGGRARLVAETTRHTVRVRLRQRRGYAFYTRAVDRAGNRERPPRRADVRVPAAPRR